MTQTRRDELDGSSDGPPADEHRRETEDPSRAVDTAGTDHPAADSEDAYVGEEIPTSAAGAGGHVRPEGDRAG
jgi:hypothetical protein